MVEKAGKCLYLGIGFIAAALGIVGMFLPLMPTTCFLIIAVWAFSKSNNKFSQKILEHSQFGPIIKNWMEYKSINKKEKCKISLSIVIGFSISILLVKPGLIISAFLLSGMTMLLFYINTRAENDINKNIISGLNITNHVAKQKIVY